MDLDIWANTALGSEEKMAICPECGRRWTCFQPPEYWVTNAGAQVIEKLCYKRIVDFVKIDKKRR